MIAHLAFLAVVFEDELARLHPVSRRDGANLEIKRNRAMFALECAEPVDRAVTEFDTDGSPRTVYKKHSPVYKPLTEIKTTLEGIHQATNSEVAFHRLVGDKQQLVNFTYSSRSKEQGAATVEFRQHRGTLDPDEVTHWVQHCLAMVRLAQRYAASESSCPVTDWDDEINIEDLWKEMDLAEDSREFFRGKIAEYTNEAPDWTPEELFFLDEFDDLESLEEFEDIPTADTSDESVDDGHDSGYDEPQSSKASHGG